MRNIIKEYIQETISTKRNLKKNNEAMKEQINKLMETLKEARDNEKYAIERMNMYKSKFQNERRKRIRNEKESKEIIEEFTNSLKELEKENTKLKKENK